MFFSITLCYLVTSWVEWVLCAAWWLREYTPWKEPSARGDGGRVCFRQLMLFYPTHHKVINSVEIKKTSLLWSFCCFNLNSQYDQYINFPSQVTWFWSSPITLISPCYLGILLWPRDLQQLPINQPCLFNRIRCIFYLF